MPGMPCLYLVRHARPEATFSQAADGGLDRTGLEQAESVADRLAPLGPMDIVISPLRRTRETAAPLERRWTRSGRIDPGVGEIPSPMSDPAARGEWLRRIHGLPHQPHPPEVPRSEEDGRVVREGVRLRDRQRRDARVR